MQRLSRVGPSTEQGQALARTLARLSGTKTIKHLAVKCNLLLTCDWRHTTRSYLNNFTHNESVLIST